MKHKIEKVEYVQEFETRLGTMHQFRIHYDGKEGIYESPNENQTWFVEGKEVEFEEYKIVNSKGETYKLTPNYPQKTTYGKSMAQERAKYASMAVSYAKDLKVAGKYRGKKLADLAAEMYGTMMDLANSGK